MHHTPHSPARQSRHSHILMIAGVLVVAAALIVGFGVEASPAVIIGARVLLIAAAVFAVLAVLRTIVLRGLRGLMHGPAAMHSHGGQAHTHGESSLYTEGITLSWPGVYDVQVGVMLGGRRAKLLDSVLALADIKAGSRVLDVGSGTGNLAVHAAQKFAGAEVSGIDASPEMVAYARRKADRKGVSVDFRHALAESMPYNDGIFDVVVSSFVIHHLPGDLKQRSFAEMCRVLKPGGRVVLVDFEPPKRGLLAVALRTMVGEGMMQIDNRIVLPLVEEAGFGDVTLRPTGINLATAIVGTKIS